VIAWSGAIVETGGEDGLAGVNSAEPAIHVYSIMPTAMLTGVFSGFR